MHMPLRSGVRYITAIAKHKLHLASMRVLVPPLNMISCNACVIPNHANNLASPLQGTYLLTVLP